MDTNIYKRNLKITPEENLQKKAQDAENEKEMFSNLCNLQK
ncbi:hypothetical protein [Spiroplasma ixodetis]|uniref:Uncharacterized protein n=1 Tax=Spiroplasma ixodetis TaxID=2141 RepID=A0ABM8BSE2_9MOLU|nr:hypothetical protein [Spiroplasma ixodetis]BDT02776.1 hypothetical protein SHM_04220 [Spiroplasma ixodetis]